MRVGTHRSRRAFVAALSVVLASAVIASACSSGSGDAGGTAPTTVLEEGTPTSGGTLKVGITAEVNGYNAATARFDVFGNLVGSTVYDALMRFDADRELQPNLAESVTPNADGTVWTIKLKPGITFHDGTQADAAAVKLNLDTRRSDPLAGGALEPVQEVVVVDPLTAEVRMKRPWFGFDALMAAQTGYLVAPATINDPNGAAHPIGTGPFEWVSWTPGSSIVVKRNPDYWQSGKPYLDGIEFKIVPDPTTLVAAVRSGDVDLVMTDDQTSVEAIRSDGSLRSVEDALTETAYVQLMEAAPPFDDAHARAALAYATDQQAIIDSVGQGIGTKATSPYSDKSRWFVDDDKYVTYDPDKAKQELDQYKQDTGASTLSFKLSMSSGGSFPKVAEALQAQWASVGIDAQIDIQDVSAFLASTFLGNFQAGMFRNFGFVNPDSNYLFWHSSQAKGVGVGSINFTQTKVPAIDEGLDQARSTQDDTKRKTYYDQVQQGLNAELPYVWLYHVIWTLGARNDVGGMALPQQLGFGRTDAKPWWPEIWLKS